MPTGKRITAAQKEAIVTLRRNGHTYQAIADKLNLGTSTVERHAHDVTQDNPKRRRYSPTDIEKARQLRATGMTLDTIAQRTGMLLVSVHRYVKDVPVPKTPHQVSKGVATYEREQKRLTAQDHERNLIPIPEGDVPRPRALFMPTNTTELMHDGMTPSALLVAHASAVLETWIEDTEAGTLRSVNDVERAKAVYVLGHHYTVYDKNEFLTHRNQWRVVRQLAGVSAEDIASTIGVSFATIGRWERADRHPDEHYQTKAWVAYRDVQALMLMKLEWELIKASYAAQMTNGDSGLQEDIIWWAVGNAPLQNIDISHITHLRDIRALLPLPLWREPDGWNLMLSGYDEAALARERSRGA